MQSSQVDIARRRLLAGSVAAGAISGFPAIVRAQSKTLVTTGYGGIHEKWFRAAVIDPFEKKTGAKVQIKYGGAGQWLASAIANKDSPEIDVPFLALPNAMQAITVNDIFLDLTPEMIPNVRDVHSMFYDLYNRRAVGFNYADFGICYRADQVKQSPASWKDLWDPSHKGKLLLPDITSGGVQEVVVLAARMHGGSEANLEPGWEALKRLKPNVHRFFKNNNEPVPMYQRGEATIGAWYSARAFALIDSGVPMRYITPKEGSPVGVLSFHVAKNTKVKDLALEFVNFALSKEAQETFANGIEYGPCSTKAELKGRAKERIAPHDALVRFDWPKIQAQFSAITERWQREIAT